MAVNISLTRDRSVELGGQGPPGPVVPTLFGFGTNSVLPDVYPFPGYALAGDIALEPSLSYGYCRVAATADCTITIKNKGTLIATVLYRAANPLALITLAVTTRLPPGLFIYADGPAVHDLTLAGATFTIGGR